MKIPAKSLLLLMALLTATSVAGQTYRALLRKANDQYELKAFNQAIETYQQVLDRRADEPEALAKIADCYWHLNQMEEAGDNFAKLFRQRNVDPAYLLKYGHTLKALGLYDEAKRYYLEYARTDASIGNHFAQTCDFAKTQQGVASEYSATEERVNSPAADFSPVFFGDQIVFASSRTDVQRPTAGWDGQARSQLFISRQGIDGYLQPPTLLKSGAGNYGEGPVSFTSDGSQAAYTRNNFVSGTRQIPGSGMEMNVFLVDVNQSGAWINERPFPMNTGGKTGYPSFVSDGSALFFASDREGGFGGYDLYISYRDGNTWTRPINLGPVVNTPGNEISPYFDGTNLYFASDWHAGFGGFDVFLAEQGDGKWVKVSNLGQPVNSSRDDYAFIFDGFRNYGFIVSNRTGGRGAEDIYKVAKATDNIVLKVINAADGSPLAGALIDLSACTPGGYRNLVTADNLGLYKIPLGAGINCDVIVSKDGYTSNKVQLSSASLQGGREVEVALIRRGEDYYGKVMSYDTRLPLEGILVTARNLATQSVVRVSSDRNGDFTLALTNYSSYLVTYSAQGYREVSRNVSTVDGQDRTILGTVPMYSSTTYIPPSGPVNQPSTGGGTTTTPGVVRSGFAIQVSAMGAQPDLSKFSKLESIGTIYSVLDGGKYKVRVGGFNSRDEAARQLAAVKRQGYSGAFIVEEKGSTSAPVYTPPTTTNPPVVNPPATGGGYTRFMIQLGAYRDARSFDGSKVSSLGSIVDWPKPGGLTAKMIAGFNTVEEARRALPKARQAGFPGAFIVEDQNGNLIKVN